jgi:hypothetical protein
MDEQVKSEFARFEDTYGQAVELSNKAGVKHICGSVEGFETLATWLETATTDQYTQLRE